MKKLDKKVAMAMLESFENEYIEREELVKNACYVIFSVAEEMTWETTGPYEYLFEAIKETTQAITEIVRYNVKI